jgi:hypothetical protein
MVAFFSFFHTLTYTIMLYAKFSSTYPSSSNPENQVVRYTLSGSQSEIADYIAKNPKAVDAVTGGAIFNLTIRPDSTRKDYPIEGPLKVSQKGNFYVDGSNVVNALNLVKQMGEDPIKLVMALTGLQGSSNFSTVTRKETTPAETEGLGDI